MRYCRKNRMLTRSFVGQRGILFVGLLLLLLFLPRSFSNCQEGEETTTSVLLGQHQTEAEGEQQCLTETAFSTQTVEIGSDLSLQILKDATPLLQGTEGDATGTVVWGASICLAKYLHRNHKDILSRHHQFNEGTKTSPTIVLELGSGVGLPSMVLAANNNKSKDVTIVATDKEEATLQQLQMVAELNNLQDEISVEQFTWSNDGGTTTSQSLFQEYQQVDVILASDVVYSESMVGPLVGTISNLLKDDGVAYLAFKNTRPGVQFCVKEAMPKAGFVLLETISCGEYHTDADHDRSDSRLQGDHSIYVFGRR